jgi:hypothetical protein
MKNVHGEDYTRLNNGRCYMKRYQKVKEEIPKKYYDIYDELTGAGKSLLSVQAAICYIEAEITQKVAAEAFHVSEVTVRDITREMIDRGAVSLDYVRENCVKKGNGQFGEYTNGEIKNWEKPEA